MTSKFEVKFDIGEIYENFSAHFVFLYLNQRTLVSIEKYIVTVAMEETRKRGRQSERWRDEVEDDLNVMGMRHIETIVGSRRKWRKIVFEAKVYSGLWSLRRRRKRRRK